MATVNSIILLGSITILKDIHKTFINPSLSEKQMLAWARIYTFVFGIRRWLIVAYLVPHILRLQIIGLVTLIVFVPAKIGGFLWKKATVAGYFLSILTGI